MRTARLIAAAFLTAALLSGLPADAARWQWSVPVSGMKSDETGQAPEAFLWVPQSCERLRAVLYTHQNMTEELLVRDSTFRARMEKIGVGIIYVAPGIDYKWDGTGSDCQFHFSKLMTDLAQVSGYSELERLPVIPFGHSAQATFPWNFAAWNPDRTLAVISYHGDAPRTNLCGYGRENVEWGRTRNIDGIPGLMIEGEYEWWEARVNPALSFRMMYPESCISFLCDAGRGHFDLCPETIGYIARFIEKAMEQRMIGDAAPDGSTQMRTLDPARGWLCERWREGGKRRPAPAPCTRYKGDPHDAFWYFDKEMASLTEERYAATRGRRNQYVSIAQNGELLAYRPESHVKLSAPFLPDEDGVTFRLEGVFVDSTRTALSDDHAKGAVPRFCVVSGPCVQVSNGVFRLQFYCTGLSNRRRWNGITLCVEADGDRRYKSAVQEINVTLPNNSDGAAQSIDFPPIPDIHADREEVILEATSDSGLPVSYYVKHGPAHIEGNRLLISEIPPRAAFPIEVTVCAWQFGLPGRVQMARPVERTFRILPSLPQTK